MTYPNDDTGQNFLAVEFEQELNLLICELKSGDPTKRLHHEVMSDVLTMSVRKHAMTLVENIACNMDDCRRDPQKTRSQVLKYIGVLAMDRLLSYESNVRYEKNKDGTIRISSVLESPTASVELVLPEATWLDSVGARP